MRRAERRCREVWPQAMQKGGAERRCREVMQRECGRGRCGADLRSREEADAGADLAAAEHEYGVGWYGDAVDER